MSSPAHNDSELALDLAAEYHAAVEAGAPIALDVVCKDHPHLIPQVMALLSGGAEMHAVAIQLPTSDPLADDEPMPHSLGRYELVEWLGQGAMGVAFRGRDPELCRDVAVKLLRHRFAQSVNASTRFLAEARITAQLQHPAIPAVHEMGTHADGRPWMAMKLIRGETLDCLLRRSAPLNPVGVFENICQGLSYAHDRGVIHRDLKPHNVMVGAFGEVQIMDWGLARVLAETEMGTDPIEIVEREDGQLTRNGQAMGSPAYMPPEQASGAIGQIDQRSDVFGLGAILCHLLTGRPPFVGEDLESTRQLAAAANVEDAFAQLDASGADPELVALCKRCLSPMRDERPADAGDVARAVAALRANAEERAKQAEVERANAEVRTLAERKRRRVLLCAVGAVIAVLVVGIVGTLVGYRNAIVAAEAERKAKREADEKRVEATELAQKLQIANTLTAARLGQIELINNTVFDIFVDFDIREVKADSDPVESVLAKRLAEAGKTLDAKAIDDPLVLANLRDRLGRTLLSLGDAKSATELFRLARDSRRDNLGRDHRLTLASSNNLALALWSNRQENEAVPIFEDTLTRRTAALGPHDPETLTTMNDLAVVYRAVKQLDKAAPLIEDAYKLRALILGPTSTEALASLSNLGLVYQSLFQIDRAISIFRQVRTAAEAKFTRNHPYVFNCMNNLATAYEDAGRYDLAVPLLEETLELRKARLGPNHPATNVSMGNLGSAYCKCGQGDKAVPLLRQFVTNWRRLYPDDIQRVALVHSLVSHDLLLGRQFEVAEEMLRECLSIREKAAPDAWPAFDARSALGEALMGQRKYEEAKPFLVTGYEGLKAHEKSGPQAAARIPVALDRLIAFSTATNKPEDVKKYRDLRAKYPPEVAPRPGLVR